ncbi:hypothetical protein C8R45DRAFT_1143891 [Mycena sanguinolenta]|nr:hypothetical protein C8R45DRAFT_1143891 [Mycena sanguinolenta]
MSATPAFSFATTADEVATAFAQEIKGKNVLLTGSSLNGIGFETARVIAKHANLVIITGYNDERLKLSEDGIKKDVPSANIRRLTLDLSSLAAVRKAAAEVNTYSEPIHVLIHNAAAGVGPFELTVDGLESQIATDHVGPFLFTKLLAPKLLATTTRSYTPRVVFVSSGAHRFGPGVDFNAITHPNPKTYISQIAYFAAKSANILTAIELSKRSKGAIYDAMGILGADGLPNTEKFQWKTIAQGAATYAAFNHSPSDKLIFWRRTVAAAFDPRISGIVDKPGSFLNDSQIANEAVAAHSSDPANAERLWTITEEIISEKFIIETPVHVHRSLI